MKASSVNNKLFPLILILAGLFWSCQPLIKGFLRVKNPKYYVSNNNRMEYYKPFIEGMTNVKVYALKDSIAYQKAFNILSSMPTIYVRNISNKQLFQFDDCYDDVTGQVDDINNNHLADSLLIPLSQNARELYAYAFTKEAIDKRKEKEQEKGDNYYSWIPISKQNDSLLDEYKEWKSFIPNKTELVFSQEGKQQNKNANKWDVLMVSGTFFGKKLRRLTLPINNLENINQLTIIDLSLDKK